MEITKEETGAPDAELKSRSTGIVRTCIAAIPAGYSKLIVKQLDDPYWGGGDGWM